tara:strand:+ start:15 stop:1172 length:1158 start_codon:yes stop_codon:yes gene_type:complete
MYYLTLFIFIYQIEIMKIIISSNSSWNILNFRKNLINFFLKDKNKLLILSKKDFSFKNLKKLKVKFIEIPINRKSFSPFDDLRLILYFLKIFYFEKPDFFLGFTHKINIYGAFVANVLNIKSIINVTGLGTAFIKNTFFTKIVTLFYKIALGKNNITLFQNRDDRNFFIKKKLVKKKNSFLIPGSGIDLKKYSVVKNKKNKKNINFLFIGRLIKDKGIIEFINAAKEIKKNSKIKVTFSVIGFVDEKNRTSISYSEYLKFKNEKILNFLGHKNDIRKYLTNSDCVVLPSYREGLPRVLLESSAMGIPAITTNVPGCREVVTDKYNGFLCKAKSKKSLKKVMYKFLNLNYKKRLIMGQNSRKKAENYFNEKIVFEKYKKLMYQAKQ